MKPLAVHHVSINVRDVEEAAQFYESRLGLVRRSDRPDFGFAGAWRWYRKRPGRTGARQATCRFLSCSGALFLLVNGELNDRVALGAQRDGRDR